MDMPFSVHSGPAVHRSVQQLPSSRARAACPPPPGHAESRVVVLRMGELWPLNPRVRGSSPWRRTRRMCPLTRPFSRRRDRPGLQRLIICPTPRRSHARHGGLRWTAVIVCRRLASMAVRSRRLSRRAPDPYPGPREPAIQNEPGRLLVGRPGRHRTARLAACADADQPRPGPSLCYKSRSRGGRR